MRLFPFTIPRFFRLIFPHFLWEIPNANAKEVFITFDDGPQEAITPWVLDMLKAYDAKATFFVVGENAMNNPTLIEQIKAEGHAIGNHTFKHISGYKFSCEEYINDVKKCQQYTQTNLMRPPYGRIKRNQAKVLSKVFKVILWNQLSGDFYKGLDCKKSLNALCKNTKAGNIIVFHDSLKAAENLKVLLPAYLAYLKKVGFKSNAIDHQTHVDF